MRFGLTDGVPVEAAGLASRTAAARFSLLASSSGCTPASLAGLESSNSGPYKNGQLITYL